ncbi:MAG: ABC transporter substrate-binding protein [Alphaproteobacteria bacterium]|nr:ABC transporter substrate-binding protein [Alphaproteobacteria bacterium]
MARARALALALGLAAAATALPAAASGPRHGLSVFGDLKYPAGFAHFDYVNPDAPKGGELRLWGLDSFDTLNPFLLRGVAPQGIALVFDTLMERAADEPDALYAQVADSVEVGADRRTVAFTINPAARFHDGTPVTAADVVFTFNALVEKGHPQYRILYRDVAAAVAETAMRVRFDFKPGDHRDLPTRLAGLPVLSAAYYARVKFDETTLQPPMGSGPYRVDKVEPGRSITYRRDPSYWGRALPVNRGRNNFDLVRWDYYRDRDVALEAFFAGAYDFREEFTARSWATQYDKPPVQRGLIQRDALKDETPSGVQAFFFNLRRDRFKDRRVRQALNLAFDFEWTNKTIFHDLYARTNSMFENSELAATGSPSPAELALLEPFRAQVPPEVFGPAYVAPKTDGRGAMRDSLRDAVRLLREAGWTTKDNALVNAKGERFTIEFLNFEASFNRVIGPYVRNLERLGIAATQRIVDVANYKVRTDGFDFDVIVRRYVQPITPGIEQRNYFGSEFADVPGSLNLAGLKDPAVDALIERVIGARSRPELVAAVRALDRVLMWNAYSVPQWFKGTHHIAFWDKFERPRSKPRYDLGLVDTWWFAPEKAAQIAAGKAPSR